MTNWKSSKQPQPGNDQEAAVSMNLVLCRSPDAMTSVRFTSGNALRFILEFCGSMHRNIPSFQKRIDPG